MLGMYPQQQWGGVEEAALLPPADDQPARLIVTGGLAPAQVIGALRDRLEDYKVPDEVECVGTLPRNANGKTDKNRLRELIVSDGQRAPGPREVAR